VLRQLRDPEGAQCKQLRDPEGAQCQQLRGTRWAQGAYINEKQ
jgi:hypothetical protein